MSTSSAWAESPSTKANAVTAAAAIKTTMLTVASTVKINSFERIKNPPLGAADHLIILPTPGSYDTVASNMTLFIEPLLTKLVPKT
jgi:hypothetical protein